MQKSLCEIIFLFFPSLLLNIFAMGKVVKSCDIHITAIVNGKEAAADTLLLNDNDSCELFVEHIKSGENNSFAPLEASCYEWYIQYHSISGELKSELINGEHSNSLSFRVKPNLWNKKFANENILGFPGNVAGDFIGTDVNIVCVNKSADCGKVNLSRCTVPIKYDVLPPTPVLEMDSLYLYTADEYDLTYSVANINVWACDYDVAIFVIYRDDWPYAIEQTINEPVCSPFTLTVDYCLPGDSFRLEAYNEYGCSGSNLLMPDWGIISSIKEEIKEDFNLFVRRGELNIGFDDEIAKVMLSDLQGIVCAQIIPATKEPIKIVNVPNGMYILTIIKRNGGKFSKLVTIN